MKFLFAVLAALIVCFFSFGSSAPQHGRGKKKQPLHERYLGQPLSWCNKNDPKLGSFWVDLSKILGSNAKTIIYDIINQSLSVRRGDGYIDTGGVYDSPEAQAYWATR